MPRAYFALCRFMGRLLRSAKYSTVRIAHRDGVRLVRKRRRLYAPALVWIGAPLLRMLDTGVLVLPQRDWERRERRVYGMVYGASVRIDPDGTVVMPCLAGESLAALLEEGSKLDESVRTTAIDLAVVALAEFHRSGFTHGDAMAENVIVDLEAGIAHWVDFETVHDSTRPIAWRRADDVRSLLVTCVIRTIPEKHAETLARILCVYADDAVTRVLAASFASVWRRSLAFHLAQAPLALQSFRDIGRLLRAA